MTVNGSMSGLWSLTAREFRRFLRQPSRIIGTLATPVFLWLFFASGFAESMQPSGAAEDYGEFLATGMITLTILFSTILASISLIQDRHEGFLQSVLVSSTPRWVIVGSKVLGGGLVAMVQAGLLIVGVSLLGDFPGPLGLVGALFAAALATAALIGIGLAAAWRIDSTAGFHGVMNILFMPMWLLSGAFFPVDGAAPWLRAIMQLNPLTWATSALGASLGTHESGVWPWIGSILFAGASVALAHIVMSRQRFRS